MTDRSALRKLASEATAGPWTVDPIEYEDGKQRYFPTLRLAGTPGDMSGRLVINEPSSTMSEHNATAAFIAAARTAIPDLLDQLDRADADLERTKAVHEDEIRRLNGVDWLRERSMIDMLHSDREGLRSELAACRAALEEAEAKCERLKSVVTRWEALGERHDLALREPGCKCQHEQGDSPCPVHEESEQ